MPSQSQRFSRKLGERRYKKLFLVAVEGKKTEPQYFKFLNGKDSISNVYCIPGTSDTSPTQVLERLRRKIKNEKLKKSDEAWIVVDKDNWSTEQLSQLHQWSEGQERFGFALSNPNFEYWLLLHFEDGKKVGNSRQCTDKLKKHLPNYDKNIKRGDFKTIRINEAIRRAKQKDTSPCDDWPQTTGTTVYKLVENILKAQ